MFLSSDLLKQYYPGGDFQSGLSSDRLLSLRAAVEHDAAWTYRSAILSAASAAQGIIQGSRSWPVIQLYYSLFYSVRSIMYANDICMFYNERKPCIFTVRPGEIPAMLRFKNAGNSHVAAAHVFRQKFPRHPLSGDIDFTGALDWMRILREKTNYTSAFMNLDDQLKCFDKAVDQGVRRTLNEYMMNLALYAFLPEDAAFALPIYGASLANRSLRPSSCALIRERVTTILKRLKDQQGTMTCLDILIPSV